MTVVVIIFGFIVIIGLKFLNDNSKLRDTVAETGGFEVNFPAWIEFLESQHMILESDKGFEIEFSKKFYSTSLKKHCELHLIVKAGYANTLNGYILSEDGRKFKGQQISFSGWKNKSDSTAVTDIVRRIMASFEVQGVY